MTHRRGYKNTEERRSRKREEGEERQLARDARTTKEQLELIKHRRGESKRETERLTRSVVAKKKEPVKQSRG